MLNSAVGAGASDCIVRPVMRPAGHKTLLVLTYCHLSNSVTTLYEKLCNVMCFNDGGAFNISYIDTAVCYE